jgi:hypothetical protein
MESSAIVITKDASLHNTNAPGPRCHRHPVHVHIFLSVSQMTLYSLFV